jgi:hypothetical protein
VKGTILDISTYAFSCQILSMYKAFFVVGDTLANVLLVLKGSRIKTNVQIIGVSKLNPEIYVFKYQRDNVVQSKMVKKSGLSTTDKNKVHHYIRLCLKEHLRKQLEDVVDV